MLYRDELNKTADFLSEDTDVTRELLDHIVDGVTADLEEILHGIDKTIVESEESPSIEVIEKYMLRLSSCLCLIQYNIEILGVDEVTSKLKAQEKYNDEYMRHQTHSLVEGKKATVKELEAKAESDSIYENTLSEVYSRAYKYIKSKVAAAESMLHVLSKMYSYRIEMAKITGSAPSRVLNEGV